MVGRFCVASLLLLSSSLEAARPVRQPTEAWNVDYTASQCVASRNYGTASEPLYLVLKPSPLGGVMRLAVVQKGRAPFAQTSGKLSFDGKPPLSTGMLTYTDDRHGNWAASVNIPMADFQANRAASSLMIWGSSLSETFVISLLPGVVGELEKCLASLQDKWTISTSDRSARIRREAKPRQSPHLYFDPRDYPREALRDEQSGSVKLVFLVDEQGGISDCSVDRTSGVQGLDAMACYVIQARAKFDPALGVDGKPIKSIYCQSVTWLTSWRGGVAKLPPPSSPDPRCPRRS